MGPNEMHSKTKGHRKTNKHQQKEDGNMQHMDYKKYAKSLKGVYIRWSKDANHIFPEYRQVSGSFVSQKRINVARKLVALILQQEERKIVRAFEELARKKYKGKQVVVDVNIQSAMQRVLTAKVKKDNDYDYGEADDESMWISACQLADDELVGVLLHEALHYIATFNGNDICEKDEHFVIKRLGDDEC